MNRLMSALFMAGLWLAVPVHSEDLQAEVNALQLKLNDLEAKLAQQAPRADGQQGPRLRLIDASMDLLVAAGTSSEDNDVIEELQGGGHDPKRRGFTLQQAELSLAGAVDPYFSGEAHIIFLEEDIELEEVFATSQSLPAGLQLEAGYFLTEFGRLNPSHPHSWRWIDQPVINGRLLGEDGTRGTGIRVGWLAPTPWFSQVHLGAQNADNASMISFLGEGHVHGEDEGHAEEEEEGSDEEAHLEGFEETVGGRPVADEESDDLLYLARWENSFDASDEVTALVGVSGLFGPNLTGGDTLVYGADFTMKWRPVSNQRGWPFVTWETEIMKRDFDAESFDAVADDGDPIALDSVTIEDWGLYSQLAWGFSPGWETGLRVDYATGNDDGLEERDSDPSRCDRVRVSPMLAYRPTEYSRIRLQYNYDDADFLEDGEAHSVWAGLEILYGAHPAHKY
jgi:hypothetical protein